MEFCGDIQVLSIKAINTMIDHDKKRFGNRLRQTRDQHLGLSGLLLAVWALAFTGFGCSTVRTSGVSSEVEPITGPLVPTQPRTEIGPFRVFANQPIDPNVHPAIRALVGLEERIEQTLQIQVPEPADSIDVFVLDNDRALARFLVAYHPELPSRRAFFFATDQTAAIYAARGNHLAEDLRHEATHALLYEAVGSVPLWLDEGLAEYFEIEPDQLPIETERRFRRLTMAYRNGWRPDLKRLETIDDVTTLSPTDYREAWAWTVLLLHGPQRPILAQYLSQLGQEPEPNGAPLSAWLIDDLNRLNHQLVAHVHTLRKPEMHRQARLQSPEPSQSSEPADRSGSQQQARPIGEPPGLLKTLGRGLQRLADRLLGPSGH